MAEYTILESIKAEADILQQTKKCGFDLILLVLRSLFINTVVWYILPS